MKKNKPHKLILKRGHDKGTKMKTLHDRKWADDRCACGYDVTLPWWGPYVVTLVTMIVRVSYVIDRRSWWILHPDEIYQTMEVGYSLMSGYGFRSYEYLPAPTNTNVSIEIQMLNSGMYGLRSFILPYIFAAAIWTVKLAGCTWSSFLIGRVFNTIITSVLPLAVFKFVYVIFRCQIVALLSCALTATSLHLAVLGNHPLVNSFTAPVTLFGMTMCLSFCSETPADQSTEEETLDSQIDASDINANVLKSNKEIVNDIHKNGRLWKNGHGFLVKGERKQTTSTSVYIQPYFGGMLLGLTTYVRPDTVIFIISLFVPLTFTFRSVLTSRLTPIALVSLGLFSSVLICVCDDFNRYGRFVFSPVQWFNFNVISPKAGKIFGSNSVASYLDVFEMDKPSFMLSVCAIVTIVLLPLNKTMASIGYQNVVSSALFKLKIRHFDRPLTINTANTKPNYALVTSYFLMILIYSVVGHKEVKIIQNLFILQVIVSGAAIHLILIYARSLQLNQIYPLITAISIISVCAINCYQSFPSAEISASDWSYKDPKESRDVNSCLDFIRNQNDVNGVMVNASVYNFGGYSVLEHDVPMLVMVHQEYHLYETKSRNRLGKNNRIRVFTDFSDFIDIDNKAYVLDVIKDANLDYVISQRADMKQFEYVGYKTVFQNGDYLVFKRNDIKPKTPMKDSLPITKEDPDIIEYEANWLITNGLYTKAIWRINQALEVNRKLRKKTRVRLYQLLFVCYGKMNQLEKLKFYQDECFNIYGRTTCVTPQEKLTRHDEYSRLS